MKQNKYNVFANLFKAMIWWSSITAPLLLTSLSTCVICGFNIEMVQNVRNASSSVSKITEIENGTDVSFFCKLINFKNTSYFDKDVVWGKKLRGLRLNNVLSSYNLSFSPIVLKDRGTYFCASLKRGLYQTIFIAVKTSDGFNATSGRRWKREDAPDLSRFFKKKVVEYENKNGYESFSDRLREYAKVVAPLIAVGLIMSILIYYLMKKFYICATYRERSKTEVVCQHSSCGQHCMKDKGKDVFNNPMHNKNSNCHQACINQVNQESNTFNNQNDDTFIFLPFLFDTLDF